MKCGRVRDLCCRRREQAGCGKGLQRSKPKGGQAIIRYGSTGNLRGFFRFTERRVLGRQTAPSAR